MGPDDNETADAFASAVLLGAADRNRTCGPHRVKVVLSL
jgi:hypothetical protein